MSSPKLTVIDLKSVHSINTLLAQLELLDERLKNSSFAQLVAFNRAYMVVTSAIAGAIKDGYFDNPKFIEKFTVCFSHYYFQVINDALLEKDNIATAWSNLLRLPEDKPLPNFIYLLMGANAHINHDLALTMHDMLDKGDTPKLFQDILKIDKLLMKSSGHIVDAFTEPNRIPRIIKDRFRYLYLRPIMYVVLYWRFRAWREYQSIERNGIKVSRYSVRGKRLSRGLIYLGRLLG
jgi:hypothetical protein